MCRANGRPVGVGMAKPVVAHVMTPPDPAAGHVGTGVNVCLPASSQTWRGTILFAIVLSLPLGTGIFAVCQ